MLLLTNTQYRWTQDCYLRNTRKRKTNEITDKDKRVLWKQSKRSQETYHKSLRQGKRVGEIKSKPLIIDWIPSQRAWR